MILMKERVFCGFDVGVAESFDVKNKKKTYRSQGVSMVDDAEVPTIQRPDELLIQVKAASLNVVDAKISNGYSRVYRRLLNSGVSMKNIRKIHLMLRISRIIVKSSAGFSYFSFFFHFHNRPAPKGFARCPGARLFRCRRRNWSECSQL